MTDFDSWLSAEEQSVWRHYLQGVATITRTLESSLKPHHLSPAEYEILVRLSEADHHRIRMNKLASQVFQSRSRLTHTITRLEKAGLVRRVTCAEDGRGIKAELTAKGLDRLIAAAPDHVQGIREVFFEVLTPTEYRALGQAMAKITQITQSDCCATQQKHNSQTLAN